MSDRAIGTLCAGALSACLRVVLSVVLPACALPTGGASEADVAADEDIAEVGQAIIAGSPSEAAQNSVVALQLGPLGVCTGTLVAPNLVLTARHCVARTNHALSCAASGEALSGGEVYGDRVPDELVVYTGQHKNQLVPAARGLRFIHDGAQNLCNHDIAFVLLDRPIVDAMISPLRVHSDTLPGELTTAVGWGLDDDSQIPDQRLQRTGVTVRDVGPSKYSPSNQLLVGEAICSGDSGGPLLSDSGEVIGVVSYGGNGANDADAPAHACEGEGVLNVYTRVSGFPKLVQAAFDLANAASAVPAELTRLPAS